MCPYTGTPRNIFVTTPHIAYYAKFYLICHICQNIGQSIISQTGFDWSSCTNCRFQRESPSMCTAMAICLLSARSASSLFLPSMPSKRTDYLLMSRCVCLCVCLYGCVRERMSKRLSVQQCKYLITPHSISYRDIIREKLLILIYDWNRNGINWYDMLSCPVVILNWCWTSNFVMVVWSVSVW